MTKHEALFKYFGYSEFRPSQDTVIDTLLSGRDVLGVMPTGAGKSVCYQIPALLLPGVTLVVSPLISLMKDQVAQLRKSEIPVAFINSSLTSEQYREVLRRVGDGRYKIIYIAPERLRTEDFLNFAIKTNISLVAVDEAHCVSQWGQDFRPSYLRIAEFVDKLKKRPIVGAFTATATGDVKKDIIRFLKLQDPMSLTTGFDRPNLYFGVEKPKNKSARFLEMITQRDGMCGVVYCSTRKTVDSICSELKRRGVSASRYHAGLEDLERRVNQDDFIQSNITVMVATNAFGMGIDKPDVRYVIHYNMPKNLEGYYQEAGRAGRDGEPSDCVLLFSDEDIKTAEYFINNSGQNEEQNERQRRLAQRLDVKRLDKMLRYCEINSCLRSYILR
ncbi:MAG: RecQ family ATP-dependent DNA helicase [Oscillospiraceae bacterium]|jgi:ATP-dependent DNA helicase RecQ|nr:RecQ family ATP-dependent DNA helicase [Oscillospiraceae bacterium]